jgi:hypothetical protein
MKLNEALDTLKKAGFIVEAIDANRERTYAKYGAKTPAEKKRIDLKLDMQAYSGNNKYVRDKYEQEEIRLRKSAVPVVDEMIKHIEKKYKVDIWSYDDGYYNPVSGAHNAPAQNYHSIHFACGPDIGRGGWRIDWYVKPDRQEAPIADTDKAIAVMPRDTFNRYTGKFVVDGWAEFDGRKKSFKKVLDEEDIIAFADEIIEEIKNEIR